MVSTYDVPNRTWTWTKSSRSKAMGDCVEVGSNGGTTIGIRDSKAPNGDILLVNRSQWGAFLRTLPKNPA